MPQRCLWTFRFVSLFRTVASHFHVPGARPPFPPPPESLSLLPPPSRLTCSPSSLSGEIFPRPHLSLLPPAVYTHIIQAPTFFFFSIFFLTILLEASLLTRCLISIQQLHYLILPFCTHTHTHTHGCAHIAPTPPQFQSNLPLYPSNLTLLVVVTSAWHLPPAQHIWYSSTIQFFCRVNSRLFCTLAPASFL